MSDDLISRKALLEEIQSFRCSITGLRAGKGVLARAADEYRRSIIQIIKNQPIFDEEEWRKAMKKKEEKSQEADARWKKHIRSRFERVN